MKKEIRKVFFYCDNCNGEVECNYKYPYKMGWHYLHKIDFKSPESEVIKEFGDKHFCSLKCMLEGINKTVSTLIVNKLIEKEENDKSK